MKKCLFGSRNQKKISGMIVFKVLFSKINFRTNGNRFIGSRAKAQEVGLELNGLRTTIKNVIIFSSVYL